MTQPVLLKQSFLIAILTGVQALVPAVVAVAALYATIIFFGRRFDPSSAAIVIVGVLCLVLVQPPREVSTQLTSARISAVADVIFRWLLLLAAGAFLARMCFNPRIYHYGYRLDKLYQPVDCPLG